MSATDVWGCDDFHRCQNNTKCTICGPDKRLLSLPGDDKKKKAAKQANRYKQGASHDDSWEELEQYVADQLNAVPYTEDAKRELRSGGIWFLPGDVRDSVITPECKERDQVTAKGKKSFTIQKDWITKVFDEAKLTEKFPALIFRFKEDDHVYFVDDFDVLRDMVHTIKSYQEENNKLRQERDTYKQLLLKQRKKDGDG